MLHSLLVQETIENMLSLACSLLLNPPKYTPFLAIPIVEVLVGHWLPMLVDGLGLSFMSGWDIVGY